MQIGIFGEDDSFYVMIANVHEFGMTIKAKKRFLVIPLKKEYKDVDPKTLDLFFLRTKEGHNFLCKNVGKDRIEFCYMLAKSVTIPERSFIRSAFDEKNDEWMDFLERKIEKLCDMEIDAKTVFENLGARIAGDIQEKIRNIRSPKNSPITVRNKGTDNPLIDTGELRRHVTWKLVRDDDLV
ncbi:hypothetical protein [Heyndrickxia coagulans]|uniref:hypothetical protein n=1 Tax=Heyndrickxia coagulans TaxID=1398 RepID=UPI001B7CDE98|nr:hypothetical protein [Heyndrickxia coagulans]